jgi:DegV family protein with EDD domain
LERSAEDIGPVDLSLAMRAGIHRLLGAQEQLDRINVFPVPDGDTGTNLAATASAILPVLSPQPEHVGRLLAVAADAALDGARGNSGAIFAQWLLGLSDHTAAATRLDRQGFASALQTGATYARDALSDPREGTIISVLRDVAVAVAAEATAIGFPELCARAVTEARRSLAATQHGLDVLEKAGVVDAGAAGFVAFIEGFNDCIQTGQVDPLPEGLPTPNVEREVAGGETSLDHRWCTECLITGQVDRAHLREQLAAIGSSLVIAGSASKARLHIHVADPSLVFQIAATFGVVSGQKADDMQRQQESTAHAGRRPVAVLTDSAGDIPEELLESLDIHVVPVRLAFGPQSYLDKVSLSPVQFYRELATSSVAPKTSQPPPGDFRRQYGYLCSHHQAVVSVHVSGRVSGTLQSAEAAATRLAEQGRVHVVDSYSASAGQGLLTIHAAECAASGMTSEAIVASVIRLRAHTQTVAYLPTLHYAVRGGRVPPIAMTISRWLRLRPLLATRPDGRLGLGGALLGYSRPLQKFARVILRRLQPKTRYRMIIAHGDVPADAAGLAALLQAHRPDICELYQVPSGAALGVHGGPGFLAVGFHPLD